MTLRLVEPEENVLDVAEQDRKAWTLLAGTVDQALRVPGVSDGLKTSLNRVRASCRRAAGLPLMSVASERSDPGVVAWGFVADGYRSAIGVPDLPDDTLALFLRSERRACRLAGRQPR